METIGQRLEQYRGIGPGFNAVRMFLAMGVLLWHCFPLSTGTPALINRTPLWFLINSMVPMFFALSGFLVIGSALRLNAKEFMLNRVARIVPALVAVVFTCAFIIGPLVSDYKINDYFLDSNVFGYLLNVIGVTRHFLPGVFVDLPYSGAVNGSLWTVRFEYMCYIIVGLLIWAGATKNTSVLLLVMISIIIVVTILSAFRHDISINILEKLTNSGNFTRFSKIVPFFIVGSILFIMRNRIPYDWRMALFCLLYTLSIGLIFPPSILSQPLLWLVSTLPLSYVVIWFGLTEMPIPSVIGHDDLSYGVYLWHFPILQLIVMTAGSLVWWQLGLVAVLPVLAMAYLSWNFVEKPFMDLRKRHKAKALVRGM